VSPNPDTIASAALGVPLARSYTLTNGFGAFTGRAIGTTLGSAKINVARVNLGLAGGRAISVWNLDQPLPAAVVEEVRRSANVDRVLALQI